MDKKNISLDFEIRFQKVQELNPSFDLARIAVAYYGLNRNHSIISKEVFENAKSSMYNIPVVGRYIPEADDFGGHDVQVVEVDGKPSVEAATVPFGVVPESAVIDWEEIEEDDGTKREYLVTDCLIWKRSYGYHKLISQDRWSQSMEITVNDCSFNDDETMTIKDLTFNALCILGNGVEPCFESANIQFSVSPENEEFKQNFSIMLSELKELTIQTSKESEEKSKEGGYDELNTEVKDDEIVETEENSAEEIVEEPAEEKSSEGEEIEVTTDEEKVEPEEPEENMSSDDDVDDGEKENDDDDNYSLGVEFSNTYMKFQETLSRAITKAFDSYAEDSYKCVCLSDFDDAFAYVDVWDYTKDNDNEHYCARVAYTKTEDDFEFGKLETMVVVWLTIEENEALEKERAELASLREYKAEKLEQEHRADVDEYISKSFADVLKTNDFAELGEVVYSLDREVLTEKLYAIRGKHASYCVEDYTLDKPVEELKIPVDLKKNTRENKYGNLFETYAMK